MWHQNNLNKELLIGKFDVNAPYFVTIYTLNKQFLVVVGA